VYKDRVGQMTIVSRERPDTIGGGGLSEKRVALFLSSFFGRGVARVRLNLAAGLVAQGLPVDLVVANSRGELAGEVPPGVRVIDLKAPRMLRALPRLIGYLKREQPHAMISAQDHANIVALWARRCTGCPTRLTVSCHILHSMSASKPLLSKAHWMRYFVRAFYPLADAALAVSAGMADDMARTTGFPRERITVLHNAVVTPKMLEDAQAPVPHAWLEPGEPAIILGVGRLTRLKKFDILIRAFAKVRAQRPARLMILGSGPEEERLRLLAQELKVKDDVLFTGFVVNPFAYMSRASLFVLASEWEGLPGVLIQAMACGCPVVSTDCPTGPDEILEDGRYGALVPVDDVEAMANAMVATLAAPPETALLQARANDFHVDRIVAQYCDLLCIDVDKIQ
jgi:glycosyltransferase involved in cell wall biosynthesis